VADQSDKEIKCFEKFTFEQMSVIEKELREQRFYWVKNDHEISELAVRVTELEKMVLHLAKPGGEK